MVDLDQRSATTAATRIVTLAWLLTAVFYFYQYSMRSAPAVMMPDLTAAFGLSAVGVASLVGLFYWGYAPFSLVAGVAMDQVGPRMVVPLGAATVAICSPRASSSPPRSTGYRPDTARPAPFGPTLQIHAMTDYAIPALLALSSLPAFVVAALIGRGRPRGARRCGDGGGRAGDPLG